jgi:hypothetical protein
VSRAAALALVAVVAAALGGCSKKADEAAPEPAAPVGPPPIAETEAQRGEAACHALIDHMCACASAAPDSHELATRCELARATPEALDLNLRAARAPGDASLSDKAVLIANARKIMKTCLEDDARLAAHGCAAVAADEAAAQGDGAGAAAGDAGSSP